jgi:tetratricopeptide (TPR) repeat protein
VTRERLRLSWALLLVGACVLVYANGLTGTFTYDDKAIVRDNYRLRSPERLVEIITTQYFGGPRGTGTAYRPLLLLSFAGQWWIHGGDPVPFHVVNVLLHAAATLLLARLLLRLALPPPIAVGTALLFAVHPIHVEAVTSIVGRGETLAATLVLGYLLCALRFLDRPEGRKRWLSFAAALVLYLAANLTKESAAVAPALVFLLLAWSAEGGRGLAARLRSACSRGLVFYAGAALVLAAVFWMRAEVLGGALKSGQTGIFELENPLAPLPPAARAVNACAVFVRMLGRLAFPLRLSSDESAWSIRPLETADPVAWAAAGLLLLLGVAAVRGLRKRSLPALGFLFMAVAALPSSNVLFPTGTIFAERLAYQPSAGFCLVVASWVAGAAPTFDDLPRGRLAVLAASVLLFSMRTIARNRVWASDEALFANMLRVSPDSAKAHYDYAYMSAQIGEPRRALEHYRRATEIYPGYWDAWAGRGRMERELGDPMESLRAYQEALRILPAYENGYFGVGLAHEALGDTAAAERAYREGLRHNPRSLPLAYRLALILSADRRPAALFAWRRALAIEPRSAAAREGLRAWTLRELSARGRSASEGRAP